MYQFSHQVLLWYDTKVLQFKKLTSVLLDLVERGRITQQSDPTGLDTRNSEKRECVWNLDSLSGLKSWNDWFSYYDWICKMNDYKNTFANMCYMIVNQRWLLHSGSILMFSQQVMSNKVEKWVALSLKYFCYYSWRWQQIWTCACHTREHSLYQ